jgi:16S rRNA G966 N2-methylase RsmD
MITWKIEKRNIEDLQGYDKNPRKFTDKGLKDLKKSLQNCGDANIITINADNTVLGGHARLTVMKQLGYTEVDVKVPEKQLSEKQVQEVVVRLNANTAGEWDLDKLQADFELDELQEWGLDIEFTELEEEKEIVEDEVPEEVETRAKRGDIWQLGEHRLMCGDSTSITDVEKLMNGEKADMVFTDPPYGISVVGKNGQVGASNLAKNGTYMQVKGDDSTETTENFYKTCISLGLDKFIMWGGNYFTNFLPFSDSWIIWDKRGEMTSNNFADGEMAWCSFHTPVRIYKQIWNGMIKEGESGKRVHPTQKPVRMLADILKDFTKEKNIIFDGFGGSGSTLLACEQINRKCLMIEYEPHYIDVIITRWENLTGQKAVLCS